MSSIWRSVRSKCDETRPGQAFVIFALLLPVLVGIAGLGLDGGRLYFERRNLQGMADAAAMVGAQVANFNYENPCILGGAAPQAVNNAMANGAAAGEIVVNLPPQTGPYAGNCAYIEVIITRQVDNWFMPVLGFGTSTIQARAVARCFIPGYGNAAVIGLDSNNSEAIRLNGGGGSTVRVVGDLLSYGGILANGTASHFNIDGSAYALNGSAPTNLTLSGESYGTDTGVSLQADGDPVLAGLAGGNFQWPEWPTAHTTDGCATITNTQTGAVTTPCGGSITVGNNHTAVFSAGRYTNITIGSGGSATFQGPLTVTNTFSNNNSSSPITVPTGKYENLDLKGRTIFQSGVYEVGRMDMGAASDTTGYGVLFHVITAVTYPLDTAGTANFRFSAYKPYTELNPPPGPATCSPYPCNTWRDIVFYTVSGGIDFSGNGADRTIQGSLYAPNGTVNIHGNGGGALVQGQVIARSVILSGNGPVIDYSSAGDGGTFGPVLVNTPNSGG